jgi:hypothetical protein
MAEATIRTKYKILRVMLRNNVNLSNPEGLINYLLTLEDKIEYLKIMIKKKLRTQR